MYNFSVETATAIPCPEFLVCSNDIYSWKFNIPYNSTLEWEKNYKTRQATLVMCDLQQLIQMDQGLNYSKATKAMASIWCPFDWPQCPFQKSLFGLRGLTHGQKFVIWMMIPVKNNSNRPIYIGKNQNPKNLGFLLYRLHCQKNP